MGWGRQIQVALLPLPLGEAPEIPTRPRDSPAASAEFPFRARLRLGEVLHLGPWGFPESHGRKPHCTNNGKVITGPLPAPRHSPGVLLRPVLRFPGSGDHLPAALGL